jgi:hypothetical protein
MNARVELPPNLLDDRRPLGVRLDGESRSTIHQLAQLTDRGECVEAARQAVELLRTGVYDLRLASVYMVGLFAERGVAYVPELLRCTRRLLASELAAPPAVRSAPRVLDTTVQWLLQTLVTHIQYHARQRDETWSRWLRDGERTLPAELGDELDQLARALSELVDEPVAGGPLTWLARWARGDLARARTHAAAKDAAERAAGSDAAEVELEPELALADHDVELEPEHAPEPMEAYDEHEIHDEAPAEPEEAHEAALPRRAPPVAAAGSRRPVPVAPESPALASLRRKLEGFQLLVERGDFAKAALVARDVQHIIERFDPVEFLPSLFAGYFRVMIQRLDELRPHLEQADDTPWKLLTRFYQADLEGFLEP